MHLNEHELKILREIAGFEAPSPWGAWVGAVLGSLRGGGYITAKFGGELTDKGRAALTATEPEKESE